MRAPVVRRLRALIRRVGDQRGLTVPELLVSMAILGTVMTGVVAVFTSGTRSHVDLDRRFQAQVELNTAIGKLRREAHNACRIASGFTTSSITLNMPTGNPPPQPPATPCSAPTTVTWCTVGSGQRYALYRVAGATCTTTGAKRYADYLTTNAVFPSPTYTVMNPINATLGRLNVDFAVDTTPADAKGRYRVIDEIVLRNSAS